MENIKIPIWENLKDLSEDIRPLALDLLSLADKEYQLRVWYRTEGPEVDWYVENVVGFDTTIDMLKSSLRCGELTLTKEQIKAILKVHVMCLQFDRNTPWDQEPEDWSEQQLFVIEQPYWQKVRAQAAYALSLLRAEPPEAWG